MLAPIVEAAPAKLNLTLHITGKREDGYHLLESLVVFTEFGDTLEFYPDDVLSLDVKGEFADALAPDPNNSVLKTARMLKDLTGCRQGARITLHKRIPVSAGLGGGSSDAAATLRGLSKLWHASPTPEALHGLAEKLGSDVPVCLGMEPAMMRGVGEQVTPVMWKTSASVVLINPRVPLSTVDVYRTFSAPFDVPADIKVIHSYKALIKTMMERHNALETPAVALCPAIAEGFQALSNSPGCAVARMAGSGATCFGMFENAHVAEQAAHHLQKTLPHWWIKNTSISQKNTPASF